MRTRWIRGEAIDFRPIPRERAPEVRAFCTKLGLQTGCPFPACKRARRCATRQALCYQSLRPEIQGALAQVRRQATTDRTKGRRVIDLNHTRRLILKAREPEPEVWYKAPPVVDPDD